MPRTHDEVVRPTRREKSPRRPDNGHQAHGTRPETGPRDNHFYDLIHGLNAIVWEADPETLRYTLVSPRAEQLLGYPAARWLAGDGPEFWASLIHPEDLPRFRQIFSEAVARPGAAVTGSIRCRHKDGRWRHIETTVRSLLDNSAVGGVVLNSRDVTEQMLAQEKLRRHETMSAMGAPPTDESDLTLEELERRHISRVLQEERGHVERAARRLNVPRSSLYQKIKRYGLGGVRSLESSSEF